MLSSYVGWPHIQPHVQTVSNGRVIVGDGKSFTIYSEVGVCQCDMLFSLAIGTPCRIRIVRVGSPPDTRHQTPDTRHQTVSGGDVDMYTLP